MRRLLLGDAGIFRLLFLALLHRVQAAGQAQLLESSWRGAARSQLVFQGNPFLQQRIERHRRHLRQL